MKAVLVLAMLVAVCYTQAPVTTINCCVSNYNVLPTLGACTGTRRLQAPVPQYCPKKWKVSRRVQAVQTKEFVAETCTNFNGRRLAKSRLLQAVVYKCPVSVNGWRCFKNNTNANCKNNTQ